MTEKKLADLKNTAFNVRQHIIRMSTDGGCFIGASLSCADLIVFLYKEFLNVNLENLDDPKRDYLFLSKGHDVPALYGTFAEIGFIEKDRLKNHLKTNDFIYWHPNRNIPGIEFYSGSLGHLLSIAIGVAIDCKLKGQTNKIVVILGDGELDEGTIWEGALVANAYNLDNLICVVDRNHFQANIETEKLIPLESIEDKFKAFGWGTGSCDGHNFESLEKAFSIFPIKENKPSIIIADTKRGKGLPSIEARADRWFVNFKPEEVEMLLEELKGGAEADLTSETIVAR
ncbi:MAG TPA: 1-deoxy-D-xylulose-5-phosphate synthase N-terminal domain-containing protein [Ignavibacteria bacterium]|nr:1-deoxy-D-xylulose-5-phosphate synthase N-terminal domain-containing protein [Ignavibacteria bacterium]